MLGREASLVEIRMRTTWWTLLLLSIGLVAMGCPTAGDDDDSAPGDDDDSTEPPCAGILGTSPEPADDGVFTSKVSVTWDAVPENGNLSVADEAGAAVTGNITEDDNGRTLIFDAGDAFAASTTFNVTVTQDCADDVPFSFTTGPYGDTVGTEDNLIDRVFHLDLGSATFTEPPAVGPLLQGFLVDVYVVFQATSDSDLANGDMHIMGAIGELDGGDIVQDSCGETLGFTLGPDGIAGTADDTPAAWDNPLMDLQADLLSLSVQGVSADIQDLEITALFHPDLTNFVGGTFAGVLDTRQLIGLVDSEDPNAICDLVEKTVGVSCEDCGNGEQFCLGVVAEDVSGNYLANLPNGLTPKSCVDIIDDAACDNADYLDENGDVDPLLCPDYVAVGR